MYIYLVELYTFAHLESRKQGLDFAAYFLEFGLLLLLLAVTPSRTRDAQQTHTKRTRRDDTRRCGQIRDKTSKDQHEMSIPANRVTPHGHMHGTSMSSEQHVSGFPPTAPKSTKQGAPTRRGRTGAAPNATRYGHYLTFRSDHITLTAKTKRQSMQQG